MTTVAINLFREAMLAMGGSIAASIVAKATIATAFGLIGAWLTRRTRAALRHALLASTFGALLALPFVSLVAAPVRIAILAAPGQKVALSTLPAVAVLPADPRTSLTPGVPRAAELSVSSLLILLWSAGAVLFLVPVVIGMWQVHSLRRSAVPWQHGQSVAERLARGAGIGRRVEVLLHRALPGPMTCGLLHPAIVLSQDAETWEEEDLQRAMIHELEHVRRGDWVSHCVARAVCAMYWFHPLVWIAWRRLGLEQERACDDAVLSHSDASAYAQQLVALAARLSLAQRSPMLAMASRADLAARVGAVLDSRQRRGRAGRFPVWLASAAAVLLVGTLSPLRIIAAPQSTGPVVQFSVNNFLVVEDVTVSDKDGRDVEGLRPGDFLVNEDGVRQTVSLLEFQKVADGSKGARSYYILGYYTKNGSLDGKLRHITISGSEDRMANLHYRAVYTPRSPARTAISRADTGTDPGITPPRLIRKQEPEYSEQARKAKWQGTVVLGVEVDVAGQVADTRVVHSLGMGLDQKAIEAVRQWKFKPGVKNGAPVSVNVQVEVNFRLL